jgi:3-phenylpropionate/trans-cinnamate dioxygenase ferredoxin subunit
MEWIKVFSSGDEARKRLKDGKPQLLIIDGKRLCMVLRADHFYVVQDSCSHNGESLSKGTVNHLGEIICPWHGHQFSLTTGRECSERSSDLNTYPVKEEEDGLFIAM